MKKIIAILVALAFGAFQLSAQNATPQPVDSSRLELVDSLIYIPLDRVDPSLSGRSIYSVMPGTVQCKQSAAIVSAVNAQVAANESRLVDGYRIRIFFDNKQDARERSAAEAQRFQRLFPKIPVYRTFKETNFKVTVGDFRTKADAQAALLEIQRYFPSSFVVKEQFKYPIIDADQAYRVDTVKVWHLREAPVKATKKSKKK